MSTSIDYNLALKLKNAGFPLKPNRWDHGGWGFSYCIECGEGLSSGDNTCTAGPTHCGKSNIGFLIPPNLSELIEACGDGIKELRQDTTGFELLMRWAAFSEKPLISKYSKIPQEKGLFSDCCKSSITIFGCGKNDTEFPSFAWKWEGGYNWYECDKCNHPCRISKDKNASGYRGDGNTPEIAVANLWLKLNEKNEQSPL